MKTPRLLSIACVLLVAGLASAEDLRAGKNFITTPVYSLEEDQAVLKAFEGLRVPT